MNKNSASYLTDILSLLFFTVLTIASVVMQETTIFYVIYVFWWDEFIKVLSDFSWYVFNKKEMNGPIRFKNSIDSRFFMLFIYIIFIIVCFGFIIEWNTSNSITKNIEILLLQNIYFNISLASFAAREIYGYRNKMQTINKFSLNSMPGSMITLHVSIILGLLFWAVATKKLGSIPIQIEAYSSILAILPFLIIKFLFEWSAIKTRRKELGDS